MARRMGNGDTDAGSREENGLGAQPIRDGVTGSPGPCHRPERQLSYGQALLSIDRPDGANWLLTKSFSSVRRSTAALEEAGPTPPHRTRLSLTRPIRRSRIRVGFLLFAAMASVRCQEIAQTKIVKRILADHRTRAAVKPLPAAGVIRIRLSRPQEPSA